MQASDNHKADKSAPQTQLIMQMHETIADIGQDQWQNLHATNPQSQDYNPFLSYAFLNALEQSHCVGVEQGWLPRFITLQDQSNDVLAAVPLYVKSHSQGEYVFDHAWADAFERAGGDYYPKLQIAVPFTPVTGPRLLYKPGNEHTRSILTHSLVDLCHQLDLSSIHATFIEQQEIEAFEQADFLHRQDEQFFFFNYDYGSFDDFLAALSSRKRKMIRKERQAIADKDIIIRHYRGQEITEDLWDAFFHFYMDTGSRKWGIPYLNRAFFSLIGATMSEDILLIIAWRDSQPIAGALNFIGPKRLYGRYWGAIEHHDFLHFEVCYYQAMDYCIENGLAVMEAGAQGEHKLARGYEPVTTHSMHYIAHPGLRTAIADYLVHEQHAMQDIHALRLAESPFRKS